MTSLSTDLAESILRCALEVGPLRAALQVTDRAGVCCAELRIQITKQAPSRPPPQKAQAA